METVTGNMKAKNQTPLRAPISADDIALYRALVRMEAHELMFLEHFSFRWGGSRGDVITRQEGVRRKRLWPALERKLAEVKRLATEQADEENPQHLPLDATPKIGLHRIVGRRPWIGPEAALTTIPTQAERPSYARGKAAVVCCLQL